MWSRPSPTGRQVALTLLLVFDLATRNDLLVRTVAAFALQAHILDKLIVPVIDVAILLETRRFD
jgi:hypothetical protein